VRSERRRWRFSVRTHEGFPRLTGEIEREMHWLNLNAGAIQALSSVATVLLTAVLARITCRYVKLTHRLLHGQLQASAARRRGSPKRQPEGAVARGCQLSLLSAINAGNTGTSRSHQVEISTAVGILSRGRVIPGRH
jgi:hypothetical protein